MLRAIRGAAARRPRCRREAAERAARPRSAPSRRSGGSAGRSRAGRATGRTPAIACRPRHALAEAVRSIDEEAELLAEALRDGSWSAPREPVAHGPRTSAARLRCPPGRRHGALPSASRRARRARRTTERGQADSTAMTYRSDAAMRPCSVAAIPVRGASATSVDTPPGITRSAVRGPSSDAHWTPQRQHASSWRAIGAWQERHKRGTCRSRIAQRSFACAAAGAARSVVVGCAATAALARSAMRALQAGS
jgi:hypothetical protein